MPIRQRRQPIQQDSCLACLRRRRCRYRTYIYIRHRFPSPSPKSPSSHPLPFSSSNLPSCSPERVSSVTALQERLPDNAGSWCVDIQSPESSVCPWEPGELRQLESGWAHPPTTLCVSIMIEPEMTFPHVPVPSKIHHFCPSSQRSLHIPYS